MKKLVMGVTIAALVGMSSSCLAGFGIPKILGGKSDSKVTKTTEAVDLSGMAEVQTEISQLMLECNNISFDAWMELANATGTDVTALIEAKNSMNESESAEDGEACASALDKSLNSANFDDPALKQQVLQNTETIKAAIEKAKEYKTQAENKRTAAALKVPAVTAEIATCTLKALNSSDFKTEFAPVEKAWNLNKKLLSLSDRNLKNINKKIAALEKIIDPSKEDTSKKSKKSKK